MEQYEQLWGKALHNAVNNMAQTKNPLWMNDASHLKRVWARAKPLGLEFKADMEILAGAVALHDLAIHHGKKTGHGEESAIMAKPILETIGFPREKIGNVMAAITQHEVQNNPLIKKSLESQILYDANQLDNFGPAGIMRLLVRQFTRGMNVTSAAGDLVVSGIIDAKWKGMHLPESMVLGRPDYEYTKKFFERLKKETE